MFKFYFSRTLIFVVCSIAKIFPYSVLYVLLVRWAIFTGYSTIKIRTILRAKKKIKFIPRWALFHWLLLASWHKWWNYTESRPKGTSVNWHGPWQLMDVQVRKKSTQNRLHLTLTLVLHSKTVHNNSGGKRCARWALFFHYKNYRCSGFFKLSNLFTYFSESVVVVAILSTN